MDNKTLNIVFREFESLLNTRLLKGVYTTEDSVRYTLFYCLTKYGNIDPSQIVLEKPHSSIERGLVDAYILPLDSEEGLVFEFKYDRGIPSGKNTPRTQKAGKVFADIFRLALFKADHPINRYFVYVTDDEMATYFENPNNQVDDFFNLPIGKELRINEKYINLHPSTFVSSVGENIVECDLICRLSRNSDKFASRIYEVKPLEKFWI